MTILHRGEREGDALSTSLSLLPLFILRVWVCVSLGLLASHSSLYHSISFRLQFSE
jgi:hypothetical protein